MGTAQMKEGEPEWQRPRERSKWWWKCCRMLGHLLIEGETTTYIAVEEDSAERGVEELVSTGKADAELVVARLSLLSSDTGHTVVVRLTTDVTVSVDTR